MTKPKHRVKCLALKNERYKMLFETKEKADRCIKFNEKEIRKNGTKKFKKLRSYYCPFCGGWHITHANLNFKERKERDQKVESMIQSARRINNIKIVKKNNKNVVVGKPEPEVFDIHNFLKQFDLKSFGGKKKFKAYLREHLDLIPKGVQPDKVFHIINEMPPEYFDASIPNSNLSEEKITEMANDLYSKIPFQKLKDPKMIYDYIKWTFGYNQKVDYEVINKLNKLCGLSN